MKAVGFILAMMVVVPLSARTYTELPDVNQQDVELRQEVGVTKSFKHGVEIGFSEEIRSVVYEQINGVSNQPYFSRAYTSLWIDYTPIPYLTINAGYTLRFLATKDLNDPNECLRHRPYLSLTEQVKLGRWKLSLRERFVADCRTDSVNPLEKCQNALEMRYRLKATYSCKRVPLKPYGWVEFSHTLNAPTSDLIINGEPAYGGQYINMARGQIGLVYHPAKRHALDFYYQVGGNWDRDINITHKKQNVELTHETEIKHVIGVSYQLEL